MSKSNDAAVSVPSVSGSTEATPVAVPTKGSRCPDWCVMDHDAHSNSGAFGGYTCGTAWTLINLPSSKYGDNLLMGRMDGDRVIRIGRAQYTVEFEDEGGQPGSTNETIELGLNGGDTVGLNEEETRLLIQMLTFHADRLTANQVSL